MIGTWLSELHHCKGNFASRLKSLLYCHVSSCTVINYLCPPKKRGWVFFNVLILQSDQYGFRILLFFKIFSFPRREHIHSLGLQEGLEGMKFANNAFAYFQFNNLKLNFIFSKATSQKLWTISEKFLLALFLPPDEIFIFHSELQPKALPLWY